MDKKKTLIRVGAVLVVAFAAGQLVQTMNAGRSTAEAPRPTDVQTVSAGATAATPAINPAIPAAASLAVPAAETETVLPEVVVTKPAAAPGNASDAPIPVALPKTAEPWSLDANTALPVPADDLAQQLVDEAPAALPEQALLPDSADLAGTTPEAATLAEGACTTDMSLAAGPQAMISVSIFAPCHAGERVVLRHGGIAVAETLADDGALQLDFPALDAGGELSALFPDATVLRETVAIPDATNRFAVQWMGDDAFQLHAFENGADYGQAGDVNAESPVSPNGGYMVVLGNPTLDFPMMAQVYTWPSDATVVVDVVIEAAVTELTCGRELLGEVVQAKGLNRTVTDLTLAMPDCDAVGDILVLNNPGQDVTLAAAN